MATRSDMNEGDLVYKPSQPLTPGVILKVVNVIPSSIGIPDDFVLTIKWLNGNITTSQYGYISHNHLNDYSTLIDEHKQKYKKFQKMADKLRM